MKLIDLKEIMAGQSETKLGEHSVRSRGSPKILSFTAAKKDPRAFRGT